MEVLFYQAGIFLAILIAGKLGKSARITAVVLICIFTILQVYMSWLLILQFIIIIVSYFISKRLSEPKKTYPIKKQELNLEIKKRELKKELDTKIPLVEKREIIQKIRKTEEKEKNIEIKKIIKNPTYVDKKSSEIKKKKYYTLEEIHNLNDTLTSDPKTHAKLNILREKLSKSHPNLNIIMNTTINKETDINIIGSSIFINSEILYTQDYLIRVINEYNPKNGYLSYNKGVLLEKKDLKLIERDYDAMNKSMAESKDAIMKAFSQPFVNEDEYNQKDTGNLKFNGIYQSEENRGINSYIRVYKDRTVITTVSTGNPSQLKLWFTKEKFVKPNSSKGIYNLSGKNIKFSTTSEQGIVKYEGEIIKNKLILEIHSLINGNKFNETYIFKKFE